MPLLFNAYSEVIFADALTDSPEGLKINGQRINNIRYADETVLLADTDYGIQALLNEINTRCERMSMKINTIKTKVMKKSKNRNLPRPLYIGQEQIYYVEKYKYLGCWINDQLYY